MKVTEITPVNPSLRVTPVHRAEEKMDMDRERDAKRGDPIIIYKRTGKIRKLNDETELGSNLDLFC